MSPQIMPSEAEIRSNRADDVQALEEDARLRNDIRLLGRILGDTVRDQEGADAFDLVERIRQTSIRFHRRRLSTSTPTTAAIYRRRMLHTYPAQMIQRSRRINSSRC